MEHACRFSKYLLWKNANCLSNSLSWLHVKMIHILNIDFLRVTLDLQQHWAKNTEFLYMHFLPLPQPSTHSLPHHQYPALGNYLCYCKLSLIQIITQSLYFTLGFTLGFVHSIDLDKFIMTYVHHYSIIQESFTVLHLFISSPHTRGSLSSFYCLRSCPFPYST